MARLVRHEATGPFEIKPQTKSVWVCACGLSQNLPYCDGHHKLTRTGEQPGQLYIYDKARTTVVEQKPDATG